MSKKNKKNTARVEDPPQEKTTGGDGSMDTELTAEQEELTPEANETAAGPETAEVTAEEAPAAEAAAPAEETAAADTVNSSEKKTGKVMRPVNFRTGASFNNAVIAELKPGTAVTLSGTVNGDKGQWYQCEFDGKTGYIKASGIIVN